MAAKPESRQLEHFSSLTAMFFARAAQKGDAPFLWAKQDGQWTPISWSETARQVASLAAALRAHGIQPGERVMLVSENRPEFCIADLAIMAAGAVTVPTYTTNTDRDHAHIITDSGAAAVIFSSARIGKSLLPAVLGTSIRLVIAMEPGRTMQAGDIVMAQWDEIIAAHPADPAACAAGLTADRDSLACLIYTSGTGGAPRGVMLHHGAILCNVEGCVDILANDFAWEEDETFLSFLPISHAYEHSAGQFLPIGLGAQIYYAEGLDKLASNIAETRPTMMIVVPRLFEMLRTRVVRAVEKEGAIPRFLLDRALALGARNAGRKRVRLRDAPVDMLLEHTIRPKVRARFGGRMKAMVSGGAPLNPDIGIFFQSLGLTLLQGYGQTEAAPVVSCNRPSHGIAMDTVGAPLKGVEVRIADDGEILVRGELVMKAYWRNGHGARAHRRVAAHRRHRRVRQRGPAQDHRSQEGHPRQRQG